MSRVIEKMAAEVSGQLGGIPWEQLEQRFGMPREELVYQVTGEETGFSEYQKHITAALASAEEQLKDVVLSFQVEDDPATSEDEVVEAMKAWEKVQKELNTVGSQVLQALQDGVQKVQQENALVLPIEQYRAIISSTYVASLYGALIHVKGLMQLSDTAPEDIVESATNVTKTLNGLARLGEIGLLNPLKKNAQATAGIPAGVAIALLVVVGIGILAWCVVALTAQMEVNRNVRRICEDAERRNDKDAYNRCIELLKINNSAYQGGPFQPIEDLAKTLGQLALFAGIGYAIFKFSGPVARKLK